MKTSNPSSDNTQLRLATLNGQLDPVLAQIKAGANVNMTNNLGLSLLMEAVLVSPPEVVLVLIAAGADVNAVDHNCNTALMRMAQHTYHPSNITDPREYMRSASNSPSEIAALLIQSGANIHATDYSKKTVHWHAQKVSRNDLVTVIQQAKAHESVNRVLRLSKEERQTSGEIHQWPKKMKIT